jgi:predicted site-specific integrase-resolvase
LISWCATSDRGDRRAAEEEAKFAGKSLNDVAREASRTAARPSKEKPWTEVDRIRTKIGSHDTTTMSRIALMDRIEARQISHLIIAHKDRLVRFGFPWFERFCAEHGTELLVLNQEQLYPEQELVQDLSTIVHCFSARLYGLRHYRKKLNEALAEDARK